MYVFSSVTRVLRRVPGKQYVRRVISFWGCSFRLPHSDIVLMKPLHSIRGKKPISLYKVIQGDKLNKDVFEEVFKILATV